MTSRYRTHLVIALATTFAFACTKDDDGDGDTLLSLGNDFGNDDFETTGDGDGDTGDGDGDSGDGDGDSGDGDGDTGDGDGDSGDGDGDSGDGDGDVGPACEGMEAPAGTPQIGSPVSHWGGGFTPDGSNWDYCELAGTPFVLTISGAWCGPCNDLAAGMAGQPSSFSAQTEPIRAGLEAGNLSFVEVLLDNFNNFDAVSMADLVAWEGMYPNEFVHLLGDPTPGLDGTEPLWIYLAPVHMGGVPSAVLVDANFNIEAMGMSESLAAAAANYGG